MNWKNLNKLLLIALTLSLSLGQLTRITLPIGGALYFHDLVLIFWTLTLGLNAHVTISEIRRSIVDKKLRLEWLLIFCVMFGWVVAVITQELDIATLLYVSRFSIYLLWSYLVYRTSSLEPRMILGGFITSGLLMLLFGFLQYWLIPDTRFLHILGWDDHYYRLIGTLFDPNFTGMIFTITFIFLEKLKQKAESKKQKNLIYGLQMLLTVGIALTFSRSSYLAFAVAVAGLIAINIKKSMKQWNNEILILLTCFPIFLFTLWIAPKPGGEGVNLLRTASSSARIEASRNTLETNWRTFLIGEGLFQPQRSSQSEIGFQRENTARFADNFFVFLYNGTGILGLLLSLGLMAKWGSVLWQKDPVIFIAVTSTLIHSMLNNTLLQPFVLLFILSGIISTKSS